MADRDIFGGRPTGQHPNPRMRGRSGGIESLRRPEDFTNLNMLGRPDLSFRYSHIDPSQRGIGTGGSGEMANRPDYFRDDRSIRGTWRMMEDARRADEMDEYGYLEGAPRQRTTFTEGYMDPADFNEMYGGVYDDEILRSGGLGGLQEQAGSDPSDWRSILRILEAGGDPGTETQTAMADERNWDSMPDLADWKQGIGPGARKPIQTIPIFPGTFGDSLEGVINDQTLGNQWAEIAKGGMDRSDLEGIMQMAYRPGAYGTDYDYDDYGPFISPSVLEGDDDWLYDPVNDEYMFDLLRGNLTSIGQGIG